MPWNHLRVADHTDNDRLHSIGTEDLERASFLLQRTRDNGLILMFPGPPFADGSERSLARKDGRKRQDTGIEQHLTQLEIYPVPYKESLEGAKKCCEGQDARREKVRDTYADLAPL